MTYYAVVTRDRRRFVIERFMSIESAAGKIARERMFHKWTVLAQDGGKSAPMRELNKSERKALERKLFPTLFDD